MTKSQVALNQNDIAVNYFKKGDFKKAEAHFKKAISFDSKNATILFSLATCLQYQGRIKEAATHLIKAVRINPKYSQAYYNLGNIYKLLGDLKTAQKYYLLALKLEPNSSHILNNLGVISGHFGDFEKAVEFLTKALSLSPAEDAIYVNLATVYTELGKHDLAIETFKRALVINDKNAIAYSNLGNTLRIASRQPEALAYVRKAVKLNPKSAPAWRNLAFVLNDLGKIREGIKAFEKSLSFDPESDEALSHLIYNKRKICDWKNLGQYRKKLDLATDKAIKEGLTTKISPLSSITMDFDVKRSIQIARLKSQEIERRMKKLMPNFKYNLKGNKLRIGYIAENFHNHPVVFCTYSLYGHHDKSQFEVYLYSYGPNEKNYYFKKTIAEADKFRNIAKLDYLEAAKKINQDGIQILVDLQGYTNNNRLEILALRPTPIQISYLGFPSSSGASFIDYLIADTYVIPEKFRKYYSEKLILLPPSYQYTSPMPMVKGNYTRSRFRLPKDAFIFSCFNRSLKIDQKTFDLFLKILKKAPRSVFWLYEDSKEAKKNLIEYAKIKGVKPNRFVFSGRLPIEKHLKRLRLADLALDPVGYSGGATTSNYLMAQVPVLTLPGNQFISRMCASILLAANLKEMIARTPKDYVQKALFYYRNRDILAKIKARLTREELAKNLLNNKRFVAHLEKAYKIVWANYTHGKGKKSIHLQ